MESLKMIRLKFWFVLIIYIYEYKHTKSFR